jgi:hypothetical protein
MSRPIFRFFKKLATSCSWLCQLCGFVILRALFSYFVDNVLSSASIILFGDQ